ncbi:class I SAM-dependent methyltransferase [Thiothrix litoralis]|uniref:Class I SAM-dependent methyltransferase n=1 Tax=Thiothrix litoralis TaxID=2891210 RepID=A0ABX7WSG6_9GAMM|nr:methyltransferase domain-containing protein [Thiothrix litoralis]QTR46432.1 class I SAM-dependent methyltransferase [Thiothrix litoralis]
MIKSQTEQPQLKILDLGCGKKKRPGSIGVDYSDRHNADIIHDLNIFPYPFESNSIDQIYLDNVLEHLDQPMRVMEEIYRITKVGGKVKVIVPYFRSIWAFIDPTHKTFYTVDSFAYYDPRHIICQRYDYTPARFLVEKIVFNESLTNDLFKKIIIKIANKYPNRYETYLSHLYPLDDITYYLTKP